MFKRPSLRINRTEDGAEIKCKDMEKYPNEIKSEKFQYLELEVSIITQEPFINSNINDRKSLQYIITKTSKTQPRNQY